MQLSKHVLICIFLMLVGFDVAKHAMVFASGLDQPWGDAIAYWNLGRDIAAGDIAMLKSEIGYRTLGYPWIVGICQMLGQKNGLLLLVLFQQAAALATNGLIAYWLTRLTGSPLTGAIGYGLAIFNTSRAIHANWVLTETFTTFLMLAFCLFIWSQWGAKTLRPIVEASILAGLAILIRPSSLILLPLLMAFVWYSQGPKLKAMLVAIAVLAIMLAPCYARNYYLFGRLQLVTFQGRELWTATFSPWPGAGLDIPEDGAGAELLSKLKDDRTLEIRRNWSVSSSLAKRGMRDADIDHLMATVAWQAIRREPVRVTVRFLARTMTFWYCWNWPPDEAPTTHQTIMRQQTGIPGLAWSQAIVSRLRWTPEWIPWMTWGLSITTWVCVIWLVLKKSTRGLGLILWYMLSVSTGLTASLEIPNYRYRMPLEPFVIVALIAGVWNMVRSYGRKKRGDSELGIVV
jgi:hypothetical protein